MCTLLTYVAMRPLKKVIETMGKVQDMNLDDLEVASSKGFILEVVELQDALRQLTLKLRQYKAFLPASVLPQPLEEPEALAVRRPLRSLQSVDHSVVVMQSSAPNESQETHEDDDDMASPIAPEDALNPTVRIQQRCAILHIVCFDLAGIVDAAPLRAGKLGQRFLSVVSIGNEPFISLRKSAWIEEILGTKMISA